MVDALRGGGVLLLAAVLIVAGVLCGRNPPSLEAMLVGATSIVLIAPFLVRKARNVSTDLFDPLLVFAVAYGVMFVLRPAYMLVVGTDYYALAGVSIDIRATFVEMQVLGLLGAMAFVTGYEMRIGTGRVTRWRAPVEPRSESVATAATVVAIIGAVAALGFLVSIGGPQALFGGRSEAYFEALRGASKYLYLAPTVLIGAALLYLVAWSIERRPLYMAGVVACIALLLLVRAPVGSRLALFPLVAAPAIFWYGIHGKRPRTISVVALLLVAVVASNLILNTRNESARQEGGVAQAVRAISDDPLRVFSPLTEGQDAAIAPALAAALTIVPSDIPHTYGAATVGDLFSRAVPRALWPDKPQPPRERVVDALFGKAYAQGTANPEFSVLFAWYLDWGWIGMGAMFILGMGVRLFGEYSFANRHNRLVVAMFAAAWPMFVASLRDTPVDSLVRAAFVVGPLILVALLYLPARASSSSFRRQPRAGVPSSAAERWAIDR
ncbi:MAG: hypothetical protein WC558_06975 [Patulibacter sp.]